jgi:hypothetical protein
MNHGLNLIGEATAPGPSQIRYVISGSTATWQVYKKGPYLAVWLLPLDSLTFFPEFAHI